MRVDSRVGGFRRVSLSRIYIQNTAFHYACTFRARTVTHFGNQEAACHSLKGISSLSFQVNGRDVANKEQTENLFAETKTAVTILVSRCVYQVRFNLIFFLFYCNYLSYVYKLNETINNKKVNFEKYIIKKYNTEIFDAD